MRPINKGPILDDIIDVIRKIDIKYDGKSGAVSQAISDLNYKVVQPAIKEANQTAKQADKLVEQSKVHDDAIKAQDEALAEARNNINGAWSNAQAALAEARLTGTMQAADHRDLVANQQALDQLTTALASQSAETVVVKQTASEASVTAKGANEAAVQAKVTAASAQTIATNASSDAIVATQTAQEAKTVATNAQGAVSVFEQTVHGFSQRVSEVENSVKTQALSVIQQAATLKTVSDAISGEVWKSDIKVATNGLATQEFVQSKVDQAANTWSLNLQSLQTQVNQDGGGINVARDTGTARVISGYQLGTSTGFYVAPLYRITKIADLGWKNKQASVKALIHNAGAQCTVRMEFYNAEESAYKHGTYILTVPANGTVWFSWHDVLDDQMGINDADEIRMRIDGATPTLTVDNFKFELGPVSTPWSPSPSDLATVNSVTNLTASLDGLQGAVRDKASQAQFNELSNLIQTKVANETFSSKISQLAEAINLRVTTKDLISQINLQAGGNGLIQINNGQGKLIMAAGTTIFTGTAFIPGAAISELSADKITSGTIATGALKVNLNQGLIDFRTGNGSGTYFTKDQVVFSKNNVEPGFIGIAGSPISNTTTNELSINYHGKNKGGFAVRDIDNLDRQGRLIVSNEDNRWEVHTNNVTYSKLVVGNKDPYFEYHYGTGLKTDVINGLYIDQSGASLKYKPVSQGTGTGINIHDALINMHGDDTTSAVGCQLRVQGWSWVAGYIEAMGHSLHSALSLKTNIERLDPAYCLALINQTDLISFTFKAEVASGSNFRHFGPIIDNVNQVAQYQIPTEFIAATYGDAPARDDDNIIGALMGAVQELTKRLEKVEKTNGI